jgi:hypothetical protein
MKYLYIASWDDIFYELEEDDKNLIFEFVVFDSISLKNLSDTLYYKNFLYRHLIPISEEQTRRFKEIPLSEIYKVKKESFLIENNLQEWTI